MTILDMLAPVIFFLDYPILQSSITAGLIVMGNNLAIRECNSIYKRMI